MSNEGKNVKVHYVGTLDDGTKFDSSRDRDEPLEFTCMAGQMIPGFDAAVKEMQVGEVRDVHIPAAEAYGERQEALVQEVPVGAQIMLLGPNGRPLRAVIADAGDGRVVFDLNHEMAGKDLNFNIELLEVQE